MSELSNSPFESVDKNTEPMNEQQAGDLLKQIPDWEIGKQDGTLELRRAFKLKNFVEAMAFANRICDLAEQEDHHPAMLVEYGRVTLSWSTHTINGLHRNDFIMAARSDDAFAALG